MADEPRLQLVTASGLIPLTSKQLRGLCANPRTMEFVVAGVSRRWLYDLLGRAAGVWGTAQHEMSKDIGSDSRGVGFWTVFRKAAKDRKSVV